eukprot:CAMPEP_0196584892 /NCGR_PEP_ID=MMETSP1081-20130531/48902_1 /TAXON_ID=36882 /ORGANISM="Pyramimonas amylifera, Strain CCMP720" /LENGTH=253 /DNA_ID=CAMNT_0041906271 /DNA_START=142 /DNA_END=900 /DNA_ORIENTATION=+
MYEEDQYEEMPQYQHPRTTEFYNTDQGNKKTMASVVAESPKKYSILHSKVPRFKERIHQAPFADYDTNHLHKTTVTKGVEESKLKYAASFSGTDRWAKINKSEAPDKVYDTNTLHFKTLAKGVDEHHVKYANVRSKFSRFGPKTSSVGSQDVAAYNTDVLGKASLAVSVLASPKKYSIMSSKQDRLKRRQQLCTDENMGPGAYDTPCSLDMKKDWSVRSSSSFSSTVPRFNHKRDPTKNLGSTWNPEQDRKVW